jgi:hypothetical protein
MNVLPWPAGLLAERLSRNLSRLPGDPTLLVSSVSLQSGDGDAVRLVVWTPNNQRWQVTFPLDPGEAERLTDLDAFVLIYRANLEEWWALRDRDSQVASHGERIG